MIDKVYDVLRQLNAAGVSVMVIEQVAAHAMRHARSMTVLDRGTIGYSRFDHRCVGAEALQNGYLGSRPKANSPLNQPQNSNIHIAFPTWPPQGDSNYQQETSNV